MWRYWFMRWCSDRGGRWGRIQVSQFVIFKPLKYSFEETIGPDVKASYLSRPLSHLIRWYNKSVIKQKNFEKRLFSSTGLLMDWKLQTDLGILERNNICQEKMKEKVQILYYKRVRAVLRGGGSGWKQVSGNGELKVLYVLPKNKHSEQMQ